MSKRLYPILVIALMASLVLPRVVSPLRAHEVEEPTGAIREQQLRDQSEAFSQRLRNTQQQSPAEVRPNVEERLQNVTSEMRPNQRPVRAAAHWEEYGSRVRLRFSLYRTRLTLMIDSLQARIERLEQDGKDVSQAQELLDQAQAKLAEAQTIGEEAAQLFAALQMGDSSVREEELQAAREKAALAQETYVEAIGLLKQTLRAVQALL